ncbi:MAG TPA: radical SAM protein [Candidatus Bathyarchaeia archaeon]|nr:radical SAM protein [Candidatus Bathyarchaeia archaeon]
MSFINRLKLLNNFLNQYPYASHGPVEVGIEITNHCNLNCVMCARQEMTRHLGHMSWKLFTKIIDQTCSTAEMYGLYGRGEPLLCPFLFKMIDYCHQKGVPVALSTNATILDKKMTEQLINHPPDHLIFAIDAFNAKTYQKIRRGGNFTQVRKNVAYFLKKAQEKGSPSFTVIQLVKQELNQNEVADFKKYWSNKRASIVYIKPVTQTTNIKNRSSKPLYCLSPWRTFLVSWQGEVYPCCLDTNCRFKLGNIKNQSFQAIWNGPVWQNLRASFKKRRLKPLCRSCTLSQPSLLSTIAISFFPELTIKKAVPQLRRLLHFLPLWRRQ